MFNGFQHHFWVNADITHLPDILSHLWSVLFSSFFIRFCCFILLRSQETEESKYVFSWKFLKISFQSELFLAFFKFWSYFVFTFIYLTIFEHLLSIEPDSNFYEALHYLSNFDYVIFFTVPPSTPHFVFLKG